MTKYVVFEETKEGRRILGKGDTLNAAKQDWFTRIEFEDPIKAIVELPLIEVHPYNGLRIYGQVMCAKVDTSSNIERIDFDNPRIVRKGEYDEESLKKAVIEAAMRDLEHRKRAARWHLFSLTWYGKLMVKLGLA